ncbi:hypothetical protein GCM10007079_42610 [Nocardiopsis terrae]|nr:hypothetical protein GCM10007079_42610 [Nocardiopsis terrae]
MRPAEGVMGECFTSCPVVVCCAAQPWGRVAAGREEGTLGRGRSGFGYRMSPMAQQEWFVPDRYY